ncbi:SWIM zinc finger family protein [Candidatus Babeliales bacterium]|nr:SWIM zinc finger family protein [Candidatus Babeliales bacterium]MCF7899774.1 SWIM zinc finger family protein [Candidatus Babeliales bacterium]
MEFKNSDNGTILIEDTLCSCPVKYRCKHTAALLIAYHHNPNDTRDQQELIQYFSKQTKNNLIETLLSLGERDLKIFEHLFKIKDGKVRKKRKKAKYIRF